MSFRNLPETRREKNGITYFVRKDVTVNNTEYERYAIQTHFVERGESYVELIKKYVVPLYEEGDILSMSEKIISMCQNNIVERKDLKIGFWAKLLSRFASSNSYGIGFHEPYKMQLVINIAGLPRILFAGVCSAVTKLFGKQGVFYKIAGNGVSGIDGFYEGSSFELYHNIALLNPREPVKVCNEIYDELGVRCMLVDANDLNVEIFGKSNALVGVSDKDLISMIKDNPAGQLDELTPLILIKKKKQSQENVDEEKIAKEAI